jgi:hypothetical protein
MTITKFTKQLPQKVLLRLTSRASSPDTATLDVDQWSSDPEYLSLSPTDRGDMFHDALKVFLGTEKLPNEYRKLYPFLNTIRGHLRKSGFNKFKTEVRIGNRNINGRADILATGPGGSAAIEVKTVGGLPEQPRPANVVQGSLEGFLSESGRQSQGLILIYVDLRGERIRSFAWKSCDAACFRPWELKMAA